jgi:hypothetical protein
LHFVALEPVADVDCVRIAQGDHFACGLFKAGFKLRG